MSVRGLKWQATGKHTRNATINVKSIPVARIHSILHLPRCARFSERDRGLGISLLATFALFTLLLEDDFQSETVNFARLQFLSTYNFPNKWGRG